MDWALTTAVTVSSVCILFCGFTLQRLLSFDNRIEQARQTAPKKQTEDLLAFIATLRKEFATLLESQDEFRDKVLRESNRVAALIRRRLPPEQGRRYDLEKGNGAEPDVITAEEAAEREKKAAGGVAPERIEGGSIHEVRSRIRDAYYKARGMR